MSLDDEYYLTPVNWDEDLPPTPFYIGSMGPALEDSEEFPELDGEEEEE